MSEAYIEVTRRYKITNMSGRRKDIIADAMKEARRGCGAILVSDRTFGYHMTPVEVVSVREAQEDDEVSDE